MIITNNQVCTILHSRYNAESMFIESTIRRHMALLMCLHTALSKHNSS